MRHGIGLPMVLAIATAAASRRVVAVSDIEQGLFLLESEIP